MNISVLTKWSLPIVLESSTAGARKFNNNHSQQVCCSNPVIGKYLGLITLLLPTVIKKRK